VLNQQLKDGMRPELQCVHQGPLVGLGTLLQQPLHSLNMVVLDRSPQGRRVAVLCIPHIDTAVPCHQLHH
jgi:hypothetical protein